MTEMKKTFTMTRFENDEYTVTIYDGQYDYLEQPVLRLIIVRKDRAPIRNWEVMQEIKNLVMGKEYTAVEVFPPAKEVVNNANAYHLWVYKNIDFRLPFSFRKFPGKGEIR